MAVVLALLSALAYAGASVLQQRAAREVPEELALRPGLLTRLIRRPMWLAGTASDWAGFGFQAAALGLGSILVVQPLLSSGLLFALPLSAAWAGRRLGGKDWTAAGALTVALIVFLLVGEPSAGKDFASGFAWIVAGVTLGAVIIGCTVAAMRTRGTSRAVLLALATAVLYSLTAVLTKSAVERLSDGLSVFATSWEPYVGAATALIGLVLNQSAFQAGELEASLPILTVVEPLIASVLGVLMLNEELQAHGFVQWTAVVLAVAVMIVGVIALARSAARMETASDNPAS